MDSPILKKCGGVILCFIYIFSSYFTRKYVVSFYFLEKNVVKNICYHFLYYVEQNII